MYITECTTAATETSKQKKTTFFFYFSKKIILFSFFETQKKMSIQNEKQTDVRTAVAILPDITLCTDIQLIRQKHDPAFDRWPPHINFLFPFIPENEFGTVFFLRINGFFFFWVS